jgi:hypothetical protein
MWPELIAEPPAIGLDPGVLPRTAGFDVAGPGAGEAAPVAQSVGGELPAVVAADELGCPALDDELGVTGSP